jgi:voltage-gated potassium channel
LEADGVIGTISVLFSKLTRSQAARLVLAGAVFLFGGAAAFSVTQSIGYGSALYWAITTATTVGYGDVTPANTAGRIVASGVMLTTIPLFAAAFANLAGAVASAHLRRLLGVENREADGGEVVIFGMHPSVPKAAEELLKAGHEVVVVTKADPSVLPPRVKVVAAEPTSEEGIKKGHPEKASQVLIVGADDSSVLVTAVLANRVAGKVPTMAVASSKGVCEALRELGIDAVVSGDELLSHAVAKSLEAPHAAELLLTMLDSDGISLRELPVEKSAVGQPLSSVSRDDGGMVLGAVHENRVVMSLAQDPVLKETDRIIVLVPTGAR